MARIVIHKSLGALADRVPLVDSMLRGVERGFVGLIWATTRALPLEAASAAGGRIGAVAGPRLRKHKHVLRNLRILYPDREPAFIEATALAIWRQIGRVLAEYPHLPTIFKEGRVELETRFDLDELRRSRTGWVFCALHQANWNLHAMGGALGGFPLSVLYLPGHNPGLERMIGRWRNAMPCGFIPVSQAPRRMIEVLREGTSVGLHMDHRVDTGELVPFLGRPARTTVIPARVALKLKTPLVPVRLERLPGVRFRLTLDTPVRHDATISDAREAALAMTAEVNAAFGRYILAKPEEWCCVKRRWEKDAVAEALDPASTDTGRDAAPAA